MRLEHHKGITRFECPRDGEVHVTESPFYLLHPQDRPEGEAPEAQGDEQVLGLCPQVGHVVLLEIDPLELLDRDDDGTTIVHVYDPNAAEKLLARAGEQ